MDEDAGQPHDATLSPAWSAAIGAAALVAYLLLAPSAPGDKDSGEFTLVLALDGVAHPTGYPLYTLLGHWFTRGLHALGCGFPYAANAWSALGGALAIAFFHALSVRLAPVSARASRRGLFALALLPLGLFALNPVWTVEATLAEVYSWHLAWVLAAVLSFASLMSSLDASASWPRARLLRHAAAWGLLCGVGGAHHVSAIYTAAPLSLALAYRLFRIRRLDALLVLAVLVTAAAPLSSYLFIYWKAAHPGPVAWGNLEPGWDGLVAHATGRQYQFLIGQFEPSPVQQGLLAEYVYPFLVPGLLLMIVLAVRARSELDRRVRASIALVALTQTLGTLGYGASDPTSYFLSPMALGACLTVPAAAALLETPWSRRLFRPIVALGVAGLVLLNVPWVRTGVSRRNGYERFETIVHSMWEKIPFERGFVLWSDDMFARLRVYQLLDGEKPELDVINPWWLFFPATRTRFTAEHGFDPVLGISMPASWLRNPPPGTPPLERILEALEGRINDHTELPVIVFDAEKRSVRLLKKSGRVPSASP
ncbi:MAG: DUF2723 domain-containing protein [bacterium]